MKTFKITFYFAAGRKKIEFITEVETKEEAIQHVCGMLDQKKTLRLGHASLGTVHLFRPEQILRVEMQEYTQKENESLIRVVADNEHVDKMQELEDQEESLAERAKKLRESMQKKRGETAYE